MKKIILSVVFCVLALCIAGCAGVQESGGKATDSSSLKDAELTIPYYDHELKLSGIWAYETDKDFEHTLYVVTAIDESSLSDKELKYIDEDAKFSLYVDEGKNEIDFDDAYAMDTARSDGVLYTLYVYPSPYATGSVDNRESFIGSKLVLAAMVTDKQNNTDKEYDWSDFKTSSIIDEFSSEDDFTKKIGVFGYSAI